MLAAIAALLCFLVGGRELARVVNAHGARASDDGCSDIAPLLLFALLCLIADSPSRSVSHVPSERSCVGLIDRGVHVGETKERAGHTLPRERLLARVRGVYVEMPGLQVTRARACRLW
jgi:hypothetical protein